MTNKPKTPIESFGSEVFNALVEGSHRTVELRFSYRDAVRLRQRIHRLRGQMRAENHQLYGLVMKAELCIEYLPGTKMKPTYRNIQIPVDRNVEVKLIIRPRDSDFIQVLSEAGIHAKPLTPDIGTDDDTSTNTPPSIDSILKGLK